MILPIIFGVFLSALPQSATAWQTQYQPASTRKQHLADLAKRISDLVNQGDAARGFWGIDIISLADGQTLFEQNADRLFAPASNAKLFTMVSALVSLGPDFRETTTIESANPPDKQGRVKGDIFIVGRGDPNLSGRVLPYKLKTQRTIPALKLLQDLADEVAQKGIKEIDGDVVGDDSYFAYERFGEGWSQDDLVWDYGAPASALTVNDNVIFLNIYPGAATGDKASLEFEPDTGYYDVDNRIITVPAGSAARNISIDRQVGSHLLTLWGTIPMNDPGDRESLAIDDPADFAAKAFRAMLQQRGIKVLGNTRTKHTFIYDVPPAAPELVPEEPNAATGVVSPEVAHLQQKIAPARTVLAEHDSAPLSEDLIVTDKVSQNLHAEITLRLLGREKGTAPTVAASLEVEKGVLTEAGIAPEEYALYDGSGLSRQDLVTPRAIVKLLQFADFPTGWRSDFRSSLPIAGEDGSLTDRMKGTVAQGRVWAKTGTLGHVNSLSGYVLTVSGEPLAFSILCNNHKLTSRVATRIMDQIAAEMVADAPTKQNATAQ